MAFLEALALFVIVLVLLYKWLTLNNGILKERGIPHDSPKPLVGTTNLWVLLGMKSSLWANIEVHQRYKDSKVYGMYMLRNPIFVIRDVDLIKKVTITDFESFANHKMMLIAEEEDNFFNKSLIALKDRKWKEVRNTLTPAFTGSKMRLMFELINDCCLEGVKYLNSETKAGGKQELELEMKEFFTRFANDVIATAAFGIKVNSFQEKNNEFYTIGRSVTKFTGWTMIKALLYNLMPKVMNALDFKVMNENLVDYFKNLVLDAMEYRQLHHIMRPDMIHLLMEAKKNYEETKSTQSNEHAEFNDEDLVAQCLLFFFAGFETVSTCLSFTAHELLENPDVQQRLYEEILAAEKELDGKPLNYDVLVQMKYMDMVLSESLRKWPPAPITDRVCSKDYDLTDNEGNVVVSLKKGDLTFVNFFAMHYDPEHFDNPMKFDPERFSEEQKHNIKPGTYLPFGVGPRNCIGNRFALMETKAIVYHILLHFKIVPSPKTTKDMFNSVRGFQMQPKEMFWMKMEAREAV